MRTLGAADTRLALGVSLCFLLGGCAASPERRTLFAGAFAGDVDALAAALTPATAAPAPTESVAIGATESNVIGLSFAAGRKWEYPATLLTTPALAGNVLMLTTDEHWVALQASTGKKLWSVPHETETLRGVADDGSVTLLSVASTANVRQRFMGVGRNGGIRYTSEVAGKPGQPAALRHLVFVPWNQRFVSALDMTTGTELWRFEPSFVVTWAERRGSTIWVGGAGMGRLEIEASHGSIGSLTLPTVGLETLVLPAPANRPPVPMSSAPADVEALLLPTSDSNTIGEFAAVHGSIVLGFDARQALRWVAAQPSMVLAARPSTGGYVLCEQSGRIVGISRGGTSTELGNFGASLRACSLSDPLPRLDEKDLDVPIEAQLASVLRTISPEQVMIGRYLAVQLSELQAPEATRTLIELASDPHLPTKLAETLDGALAKRRVGKSYMLEALSQHFDFLENQLKTPPIGALADALAAMGERSAAPLLAKHLNDPANSPTDVKRAARALQTLAAEEEAPELRTFFALYRATADRRELVEAVLFVARALLRLGGGENRSLVERAARDALTQADIRRGLEAVLRGVPPSEPALQDS